MISKLLSFSILASLLTLASAYGEEPEWKFSQSDADTIKFADIRNASRVIGDLWRHVGADADPLKEAVPALIFRFWELEKLTAEEHDRGGEIYWGTTKDILWLLSKIGDLRGKAVLIEGMKHGSTSTEGLQAMGPAVIPDILTAIKAPRKKLQKGGMRALRKIHDREPSFFDSTNQQRIREDITLLLAHEEGLVRHAAVLTLRIFGDAETIPVLELIQIQDPFTVTRKGKTIYLNRRDARLAIEAIRSRIQQ